ncbi:MAG TPA: hypothetical protein VI011_18845 [Asanoa sp.]|jgi:hypothetical protein
MLIDCDSCTVRGAACQGCLVSALFETPPEVDRLTGDERGAIEVFARTGFDVEVLAEPEPPLRLVPRSRRARFVA